MARAARPLPGRATPGAAPAHLGASSARLGLGGRMDLPPVAAVAPLRGWFFLGWGTRVEALACSGKVRLSRLLAQRRWATDAIDPRVLLALASLPAWTLCRPRGTAHLPATLALLDELTTAAAAAA